jgi:hypothetical protein
MGLLGRACIFTLIMLKNRCILYEKQHKFNEFCCDLSVNVQKYRRFTTVVSGVLVFFLTVVPAAKPCQLYHCWDPVVVLASQPCSCTGA